MDADDLIAEYGAAYFEADLALGPDGDLVVAHQDYATANWAENLNASLLRRLNTPRGAVASSVRGTEGVLVLNAGYGNPAFRYLSEPLNAATTIKLRQGILTCLADEDRIDVLELNSRVDVVASGLPLLVFDLTYTLAGTGTPVVFSFGADQVAGVFIEVLG